MGIICYLNQQLTCFGGQDIEIPGGLSSDNIRECCVNRNGFAVNLFRGDEDCTECIGKKRLDELHAGCISNCVVDFSIDLYHCDSY